MQRIRRLAASTAQRGGGSIPSHNFNICGIARPCEGVGEVLFEGTNAAYLTGLWVTDGTAAGTHQLTGRAF